jgi:hypothetical protein
MITLKKTAEELENEKKLEFLLDHYSIREFLHDFYDESMLCEVLQEDVANNDAVTIKAMNEFVENIEDEYQEWLNDQNKPEEREER